MIHSKAGFLRATRTLLLSICPPRYSRLGAARTFGWSFFSGLSRHFCSKEVIRQDRRTIDGYVASRKVGASNPLDCLPFQSCVHALSSSRTVLDSMCAIIWRVCTAPNRQWSTKAVRYPERSLCPYNREVSDSSTYLTFVKPDTWLQTR